MLSFFAIFNPYVLETKMHQAILTLQYPRGLRGLPVATTSNPKILHFFKQSVLREWQERIGQATDEGEVALYQLEYQRLRAALNILIPDKDIYHEKQS